jgi:hypothetical protein
MPRCYEGHRGLRELAADWREAWERMDVSPAEVLDARHRIAVTDWAEALDAAGISPARRPGV